MERKLFVESCGVLHKPALKEEAGNGGKWTATVWKLGEMNLNGHIYSMPLAQRIVSENKATIAYDGHDVNWTTGEEYGIAKAVCSNPRIEGLELKVDIDFVDREYEKLLISLSEKGIAIGVSSVGWGELDPVSGIIIPETYELVRYLDFVTMPAGEVYAKMGEKAGNGRPGRSPDPVGDGDKAVAERRRKVAEGLADLLMRRKA